MALELGDLGKDALGIVMRLYAASVRAEELDATSPAILAPGLAARDFVAPASAQIRKLKVPVSLGLAPAEGDRLGRVLQRFPRADALDMAHVCSEPLMAAMIAGIEDAPSARRIRTLDITACKLGDETIVRDLCRAFGHLTHLKARANAIRPAWLAPLGNTLRRLDLSFNGASDDVADIVDALPHLEHLDVGFNDIVDIAPLSRLTSLQSLNLGTNLVGDVAALASLTRLTRLKLFSNRITDLAPLAGLTGLADLDIGANSSYDANLSHVGITDLSPLRQLTRLTRLHTLALSSVTDVSPLSALRGLEELVIWGSSRLGRAGGSGIAPLAALTALTKLSIWKVGIESIEALAALKALVQLDVSCNNIGGQHGSLALLGTLTALEELCVRGCNIQSPSALPAALSRLSRLKRLDLSCNGGWDRESLAALADLRHLTNLDLTRCNIPDPGPLAALTGLRVLDIPHTGITDVTPLTTLTNLYWLNVKGNGNVMDFGPLTDALTDLVELAV